MRHTKPERPTPYSRYNYPTYEDYIEKMEIYKDTMAIYTALGLEQDPHNHDWIIVLENTRYRNEEGNEYVVDVYKCECGAGGLVKTPKLEYDRGNKTLGIKEL